MSEFDAKSLQDPEVLKAFNDNVVEEFRANDGKVGGPFEHATLVLLTTTGAKSGQPRVSPLSSVTIDGRLFIVGSYAGAPKAPAWVHNLRANPAAHVEVGSEEYDVTVRELPLDERNALWPKVVEIAPFFGDYQDSTSRILPLFDITHA